jgi:hypothetical protein
MTLLLKNTSCKGAKSRGRAPYAERITGDVNYLLLLNTNV